jgi:hypothetical protein
VPHHRITLVAWCRAMILELSEIQETCTKNLRMIKSS